MGSGGDDHWPPLDVDGLIAALLADRASPEWGRLLEQVRAYARIYGARYSRHHDDPEDIAGEVMVILTTPGTLESFRKRGAGVEAGTARRAFLAFLAMITRRVWLNLLRYDKSHIVADALPDATADAPDAEPAAPDADVDRLARQRMLIRAAYERLHAIQGEGPDSAAKVLRYLLGAVFGVPYAEVAERCGCTEPQVRQAVYEMRRRLAGLLRQHESEGPPVPADPPPRRRAQRRHQAREEHADGESPREEEQS